MTFKVGDTPPNLQPNGSFEVLPDIFAHAVVGESGESLVVDKLTGLFVIDPDADEENE